ncbi:hypothetical protein BN1723_004577 [Verticillium longisporum]|uniref:Uncharacterized protein n=1 Tax=Verticillium longisporum TaxID=100787 RepID=A0A0G4MYW1_VERLO|nr:hypothetical protein BN1723_004577 [Verticillium longisporum]
MSSSRRTEDVAHVPPTLSDLHCFTETEGVITTTMFDIPGYRVVRTLGAVYGLTVRSRNWAAGLGMVLKSIAGGELRWFTTMLYSCRNDAISRVVTETKSRGGNAVIALRFDAAELGGFAQVCAYGTACVVEKIEEHKGSIAGGELRWFTTMLYSCRNDAISRVVTETKSRGGNAVIALRFDAGELGGFAQVCAYGTACVVEKIEDRKGVAPQLEA